MVVHEEEGAKIEFVVPTTLGIYKKQIKEFWKLYSDSPFGLIGLYLVIFFVIIAVSAPFLALYDPMASFTGDRFESMSLSHPLGTDRRGRDIFSQMVWGTQISLLIGIAAAFISVVIGTLFGVLAGYFGGWLDAILMRITDFFIQIPTLPLILVVLLLFRDLVWDVAGAGTMLLILVIGLLGWTGTARMVRSEILSLKERPFIEATKAIGAKDQHIIASHLLPNVFPLIFANAILTIVDSIIAEAGISFLGFGGDLWSWGKVLYEARVDSAVLTGAWWHFVPPGICIMLLALGFALISYSLNEVVNPRLRER
ncbi:MAG: ABC transporter permease [Promethearchaeota archaeon]